MSKMWPTARLGEVLKRAEEIVTVAPDVEYREVTVKLWGKGVVLRGIVSGAQIAGNRRFMAKAGQFILSRIDARNGAVGIVPPELNGAIVTNDFPLFDVDRTKLETAFLGWISKTQNFVDLCKRASEGTTNRVRLQEDRFFALKIPLPPLAEQQRIMARIEEFAAKIAEARSLRQQAVKETEALYPLQLAACMEPNGVGWQRETVTKRVTTSWVFVTFGDSGSRKQNCHERGEGGELGNPC
jgi:type I restriction enzyme, S subunit